MRCKFDLSASLKSFRQHPILNHTFKMQSRYTRFLLSSALTCLAASTGWAQANDLPVVTSGTLVAQFVADSATMDLDASNAVTAWRANNDSSMIELTASGSGAATNLLYVAGDLNGHGAIQVNDFSGDTLALSGSMGNIDLVESTIFWLGYYAPGRDGSTGDSSGLYAYNYYNGSSYISHQSDDGVVEHYSPTRAGDAIDALEGEYQVWTSVTYGASPGTSMFVNGVDLNVAPHDGIASNGDADTFHMFRYSSSGYNFVGNMHECIIYDGALSAADIAAVEAYLDAKRAPYDGLPEVSSGALAAHFVADPSTMDVDPANNAVTAWRASNNSSIELTASGSGAATNLLYDAGDLHGNGAIQVNDFSGDTLALEGTIGNIDLVESTIFWLGYYAPGRDGSTGDSSGLYAYNYYNGSSYISHQSDDGVVEHYSPTRAGDAIDALEGEYQVWTSVTYGASPGTSMFVNGVDLNVAPHDGIASNGDADTFHMFRYSSSGYNFVGNMHECIIYNGALSAADIATIEAYLDAKRQGPITTGTDSCSDGSAIAGDGVFAFDATTATTGAEGQNEYSCYSFGSSTVDNDIWFEWTADTDGTVNVSTCNDASADTKIAAYPGNSCPADGSSLACNDDGDGCAGFTSSMDFACTSGSVYMIQVGHFPGTPGGIGNVTITQTVPCPADTYCYGDGSGAACPCGNSGGACGGCANSSGTGATLSVAGTSSLTADSIVLTAEGLLANQPCLFFSGTNQINSGNGISFGDGLRCTGNAAVRIEIGTADSNGSCSSSVEVSTHGQAYGNTLSAGEVVNYQCWYRDNTGVCMYSHNLTNGLTLTWDA